MKALSIMAMIISLKYLNIINPQYNKSTGTGQHGNHPNYNRQIANMKEMIYKYSKDPHETYKKFLGIVRQYILDHPEIKINDIDFNNIDFSGLI